MNPHEPSPPSRPVEERRAGGETRALLLRLLRLVAAEVVKSWRGQAATARPQASSGGETDRGHHTT